jgi:hypothetical protein
VCFSLMARTTASMENRKSISSGGEANSMQRQESSEETTVSKSADEVQEMDSWEEKRSRPVNS